MQPVVDGDRDDSSDNEVGSPAHGAVPLKYLQGAQPDCSSDYRLNQERVKTSERMDEETDKSSERRGQRKNIRELRQSVQEKRQFMSL